MAVLIQGEGEEGEANGETCGIEEANHCYSPYPRVELAGQAPPQGFARSKHNVYGASPPETTAFALPGFMEIATITRQSVALDYGQDVL